jgi:hypothetical protein
MLVRNCATGREQAYTLRRFADVAKRGLQSTRNLYARDLACPSEWLEKCAKIIPSQLQWGGRFDLSQWLPDCARSEVMMAYIGSEGS